MTNKLNLALTLTSFLFVIWLIGCSESPDPVVRPPYYDRLDELDGSYFNYWRPYPERPGYNKATFIFFHEPVNLRVTNMAPNEPTYIIGWRLEKTKGWWSDRFRDLVLLEVEYHCESEFHFLIQWGGHDIPGVGYGSAEFGLRCVGY